MNDWRGRTRQVWFTSCVAVLGFVDHHNRASQTPAYALAVGGAYAAASMSGDMTLIIPVLIFGWLFACIGITLNKNIEIDIARSWFILLAVPFIAEGYFLHQHFAKSERPVSAAKQESAPYLNNLTKTFRQLFDTDFKEMGSLGNEQEIYNIKTGKLLYVVPTRIHYEYKSGSKFISIYLPGDREGDLYVCMFYASHLQQALKIDSSSDLKFRIERREAGDSDSVSTENFVSSGIIYIYAIPELTIEDKAEVVAAFKKKGVNAIFRGVDYYSHNLR